MSFSTHTLAAPKAGIINVSMEVQNPARAASSPSLLQELDNAGAQLAGWNSGLKLPVAPLPLIPLPAHKQHVYKATGKGARASSVSVSSDNSEVSVDALPAPGIVEVPKVVVEYPVPGARETHEMAVVGHNMLLVTQQSNSTLVKVQLSPTTGRPISCSRFLMSDFWAGLHGLCTSQFYENQVWATLQYQSLIIRIEAGLTMDCTPVVREVITLPDSVNGPHCVCECGPDLWTGCKDSSHMVRVNFLDPTDFSVYPCSARPIMMARHPTSNDMYASLDSSSKIWRLKSATNQTEEIDIPVAYGTTPVGLVPGTDGNVWFTLVGGASGGLGTFARILPSGQLQWFKLTNPLAANAGLLHLAFDWHEELNIRAELEQNQRGSGINELSNNLHRLWLLSTSLVADPGHSADAVFSVLVDTELGRITTEQSIMLPTQRSAVHRIIPHRTGLFVSELRASCIAHVTGAAAFRAEDIQGDSTDFYALFGLGKAIPSYIYDLELPKSQRNPTRFAPCPLPPSKFKKPLLIRAATKEHVQPMLTDESSPAPTTSVIRGTKRTRAHPNDE